ncbi:MAG TPA: hypothetical protein VEC01_04715 [Noviherbaspirillum sp.]|uniref:DUF6916 family protein n=1 Tax=Noviherbaspirillum sp. TaxID=1926288 RepID=UPI002D293310|nr:hypothetical protein [Noviherbaspirillum sp.]HYD94607.1 hypothetical protein [Noviherbaspirillum sp.]
MKPSLDVFSPLVGSKFMIETLAGPVALLLVEAREYPRRGLPAAFPTPLSLILTGPLDLILSQDNYYVDHPALGRHAWCIAPIAPSVPAHQVPAPPGRVTEQRYQILFS